jgi:hypothetical protein
MKKFLLWTLLALAGCQTTVSKDELDATVFGPRPERWQESIRAYLEPRVPDLKVAVVTFRTEPQQFVQKETLVRKRQWGWAVCVWVFENHPRGYPDTYPMTYFFRDGVIVEVNGGPDDANVVGGKYAREQCERLGAPFTPKP